MPSIRKHHEDFIREMQAPLKSFDSINKYDTSLSDRSSCDESVSDQQLIAELQQRFDELFGLDDDNDDDVDD